MKPVETERLVLLRITDEDMGIHTFVVSDSAVCWFFRGRTLT